MSKVPSSLVGACRRIRWFDVAAGALAPILAFVARHPYALTREQATAILLYAAIAAPATLASVGYFRVGQILSRFMSEPDLVRILLAAAAASALTAAVAFSVMRLDAIPRSMPALHFLAMATLLAGSRLIKAEQYRRLDAGKLEQRPDSRQTVIIIGATRLAWLYLRMLSHIPGASQQRVLAVLDDNPRLKGRTILGVPILGSPKDLPAVLSEYAVHGVEVTRVIVAHPDGEERSAAECAVSDICAKREIAVSILADQLHLPTLDPADLDGSDFVAGVAPTPAMTAARYWRFRRVADVVVSAIAILVLLPLFALVAIIVMVDVGAPVVFWQERVGQRAKRISVHKFRTLRAPVDRHGNQVPEDQRLSRIGHFLRATRLDEMPQLLDVLRGEMTLIGPRPLLPVDQPCGESTRLQSPPGLTGWAQVHGGKLVTAEEKNALDEWYVRHVSPLVDLRIIRLTLLMPFRGDRRRERILQIAMRSRSERLAAQAADANQRSFIHAKAAPGSAAQPRAASNTAGASSVAHGLNGM